MTVVQHTFKFLIAVYIVFLMIIISKSNVLADVPKLLAQGDQYRLMGEYSLAEKGLCKSTGKRTGELSYFKIASRS